MILVFIFRFGHVSRLNRNLSVNIRDRLITPNLKVTDDFFFSLIHFKIIHRLIQPTYHLYTFLFSKFSIECEMNTEKKKNKTTLVKCSWNKRRKILITIWIWIWEPFFTLTFPFRNELPNYFQNHYKTIVLTNNFVHYNNNKP